MSTLVLAGAALAVSLLSLASLCAGDPKRRRAAGLSAEGAVGMGRKWMVAATLAPGLACVAAGDAAAFLVWLGGTALIGWLLALTANRAR